MAPEYSVVIPAYNAEKWIAATLDSFVAQTTGNFEVVIVDDGSEDLTAEVAESYRGRLDIRVFRERPSGGPARPLNVGIRAARADLIVHCDADDLARPDRLVCIGHAWEAVNRKDCVIFHDFCEIDCRGRVLTNEKLRDYPRLQAATTTPVTDSLKLIQGAEVFDALLAGNFVRPCAAAIPKRVLTRVGGFDEHLKNGQDYDLHLRVAREVPFLWLQKALGLYRRSPDNISSKSAAFLTPSRVAVLNKVLEMDINRHQKALVLDAIAKNYRSLGYELGEQHELIESLRAYGRAFRARPEAGYLKSALGSIVKRVLHFGGRIAHH